MKKYLTFSLVAMSAALHLGSYAAADAGDLYKEICSPVKKIIIHGDDGKVNIETSPGLGSTFIRTTNLTPEIKSAISIHESGDTVTLTGKRHAWFGFNNGTGCSVQYDIKTLPGVDLEVKFGSAEVQASNSSLGHTLLKSGSLSFFHKGGQLKDLSVESGMAQVEAQGVSGNVDISVGSGNFDIQMADPSGVERRTFKGEAGTAEFSIMFPATARVAADLSGLSPAVKPQMSFATVDKSQANFLVKIGMGMGKVIFKKNS